MATEIRHQIKEIEKQVDEFEIGNMIRSYGYEGSVLKNGNVLVYFNDKTLEITNLGISIGNTEHYIKLHKQEIKFLTKAFKIKLASFNLKREEKRTAEEKEYLDQIKFKDSLDN